MTSIATSARSATEAAASGCLLGPRKKATLLEWGAPALGGCIRWVTGLSNRVPVIGVSVVPLLAGGVLGDARVEENLVSSALCVSGAAGLMVAAIRNNPLSTSFRRRTANLPGRITAQKCLRWAFAMIERFSSEGAGLSCSRADFVACSAQSGLYAVVGAGMSPR